MVIIVTLVVKISFASCKGGKYFAFGILRTHANSTHHISLFKSARYFPETLQDITLEMVSERKWDKETRCHQNKLFLHSVISNFEDERLIKKNIYSFLCDNIVTCNAKAILSTWCPCLVLLLSFMLMLHLGNLNLSQKMCQSALSDLSWIFREALVFSTNIYSLFGGFLKIFMNT